MCGYWTTAVAIEPLSGYWTVVWFLKEQKRKTSLRPVEWERGLYRKVPLGQCKTFRRLSRWRKIKCFLRFLKTDYEERCTPNLQVAIKHAQQVCSLISYLDLSRHKTEWDLGTKLYVASIRFDFHISTLKSLFQHGKKKRKTKVE